MAENFFNTNNKAALFAVSSTDGKTPVYLWADPVTHALAFSASVSIAKDPIPASALTSALSVQIVDGSGNQITSFGGGTQYTDGGIPPTHPTGPTIQWSDGTNWQTVSTAKPLPVTASISTAGLATSVKQSDGSQKTQIVDGSGNVIAATSNALNAFLTNSSIAVTAISNALPAGTNLLGKVGIDQTTPGTTNAVSANQGTAAALSAGWPVINGELADTTGTFTNATQTTSVTASNLDGYANVLISINGTYGTATAVFEGSDDAGTTWYPISEADRTDSNVIESGYTSLTNTNRAWQISIPGFDAIRARSTAVASGTVNVRISPSAAPTSAGTTVSIGNSLPVGTNAIGGITGAGSNAQIKDDTFYGDGVTSGILSETPRIFNGTSYDRLRGVASTKNTTGAGLLGTSVLGFDGTNYQAVTAKVLTNSNPIATMLVDGSGTQITSFGGGTQYAELITTSPATGTAMLGRYQTSAPTLTNGQMFMPQLDASGNLKVTGSLSVGGTTDSATFTAASSSFTGVGGVYNDSIANLSPGQQGALRLTADRRLKVDIGTGSTGIQTANTQQIAGNDIATTNDGTQLVSIAGPTGDPIDTTGNSLNVQVQNTAPLNVTPSLIEQVYTTSISPAANKSVIINLTTLAVSGILNLSGTFSASIQVFISYDGLNFNLNGVPLLELTTGVNKYIPSTAPASTTFGEYRICQSLIGVKAIKVAYNAYTSGAPMITLRTSQAPLTSTDIAAIQPGIGVTTTSNGLIPLTGSLGYTMNSGGGSYDPLITPILSANAVNSTGTGLPTTSLLAQLDDTAPTAITENQFGNVRMSSDRGLLVSGIYNTTGVTAALRLDVNNNLQGVIRDGAGNARSANVDAANNLQSTIRDAAGNARGANVNASNQLSVSVDNYTNIAQQVNNSQVAGIDIATVADGVQLMAIAGPTGDPINTIGNAMEVAVTRNLAASDETSTIFNGSVPLQPQFAAVSTSASGITTIVNAVPGKSIRVIVSTLVANGAVNVKWQSGSTDVTGLYYLAANTGVADAYSPVGHFQTNPGQALNINLSGSVAVGGKITYLIL